MGKSAPRVGSLVSTSNTIDIGTISWFAKNLFYGLSPVFVVAPVPAVPELTIAGGAAITEGGNATFTITSDIAASADLTVNLSVADAASPRDFVAPDDEGDTTVTIAAGASTATFTLATVNDSKDIDEADGSVSVSLKTGTGYTVGTTSSASVAVTDNDATTAVLEGVAVTLPELSTLDFTVRLNRVLVSGEVLAVPVSFAGTVNAADYEVSCPSSLPTGVTCGTLVGHPSSLTVTFTGPSAQLVTLTLSAAQDNTAEAAESMVIGLGTLTATGLSGGTSSTDNLADFNIVDGIGVQLNFTLERSSVAEGQNAEFSAYVTSGDVPDGGVVLPFKVNSGESVAGDASSDDYGPVPEGISIAAGGFKGTANVPIKDDTVDEPRERLRFLVEELPPGYAFAGGSFDVSGKTATIFDNESTPLSLTGGGTITEGNVSSSATITIRAARSFIKDPFNSVGAEKVDVPLALTTSTGAALPGSASPLFTVAASGTGVSISNANTATPTITFTGHASDVVQEATVTFTATATSDSDTAPETVNVAFGELVSRNVDGGVSKGSSTSATLTIADGDAPPELSVAVVGSATATEGGSATIRVTRTGGDHSSALSFSATTTDATGFSGTFGNVTSLPANQSSVDITYSVTNNSTDSPPGAATYALNTNLAYTISSTAGSVALTVVDDDATTVTLAGAAGNVEEGENKTVTVTLGRGLVSGETLEVPLTFVGMATRGTDYTLTGASGTGLTYQNLESGSASVTFTGPNSGTTATVATLTLDAAADEVDEPTPETVDIGLGTLNANSGTGLDGGASGTDNLASFSIEDPPGNGVDLSVSDGGAATEGGSALTITATLERANDSGSAISIPIEVVSNGTTAQSADYTVASSISIANNAQSGTTSFTVNDDDVAESSETVAVAVGNILPLGIVLGTTTTITVTITDDEEVGLVFSPTSLGVTEGATGDYTVKLASEPTATVTVTIASNNTDVTVSPTPLTFNASGNTKLWSATQTVTVTAAGDSDTANDQATLTHTASGGDYGTVEEDFEVTVTDNDQAGLVFSPTSLGVTEGATEDYTVKLATQPTSTVTVTIASNNTDVTFNPLSLTFNASGSSKLWSATQTVTVTAREDADLTNDQATLTHAASGGGYSLSANLAVTVTDNDDPAASFASGASSAAEGAGTQNVTVNLSPAPPAAITLSYTVGGTATEGADYTTLSRSVAVNANATSVTIPVTITDDSAAENDETIILTLTSGNGYTVGAPSVHTLTITDNDDPAASFASGSSSAAEGDGTQNVTVNLSPAPPAAITLSYTVGGTATPGADYTTLSRSVPVSIGATSVTIPVTITDDSAAENDETIILTLTSGNGYTVGSPSGHTFTITDNDEVGLVFSPTSLGVTEGATGTYTVKLASEPTATVTVAIASDNPDVTVNPTSLTFNASGSTKLWSETQTVNVTAAGDSDTANDQATLTHTATGGDYGTVEEDFEVTVTDNDQAGLVFSPTSLGVTEGAAGTYTVKLATQPTSTVTVAIASNNTDVTVSPTSLTFNASGNTKLWSTTQTVTVTAAEDADLTNDQATLTHAASGGGYSLSANLAVTVTDNDDPAASFASAASSAAEGDGTQNVTVNLSPAPPAAITLSYTVGGTATEGADYTTLSRSVAVNANATSVTIPVTITDDLANENDETIILTLTSGNGYTVGAPSVHTLTIQDNDGTPPTTPVASFASAASSAAEGDGTQNVTVNLSPTPPAAITLSYTLGGTATEGADYTTPSVAVAAGATSVTIPVTITDDLANENDETIILTLTSGNGYTVGAPSVHTLTIQDNDGTPPTTPVASFASAASSAAEGDGTQNVTVNLSPTPPAAITLSYTLGGTATEGADYTTPSVAVAGGATSVTIPVTITDDLANENDETIILTLTSGNGYTVGAPSVHTLTIQDNDGGRPLSRPSVRLSAAPNPVTEGNPVTVTARLSEALAGNVTIPLALPAGTAEPDDYGALASITISGGQTSGTGTVATTQDDDDDETFTVALGTLPPEVTPGSPASIQLTIRDDDRDRNQPPPPPPVCSPPPPLGLTLADTTVVEGDIAPFVVRLKEAMDHPVCVEYVTVSGTAKATQDYKGGEDVILIRRRAITDTIKVPTLPDAEAEDDETFMVLLLNYGAAVEHARFRAHRSHRHHSRRRQAPRAPTPVEPDAGGCDRRRRRDSPLCRATGYSPSPPGRRELADRVGHRPRQPRLRHPPRYAADPSRRNHRPH